MSGLLKEYLVTHRQVMFMYHSRWHLDHIFCLFTGCGETCPGTQVGALHNALICIQEQYLDGKWHEKHVEGYFPGRWEHEHQGMTIRKFSPEHQSPDLTDQTPGELHIRCNDLTITF